MDVMAKAQSTLEGAHAMIASVTSDERAKSTPCTEWNVSALVEHMIGVVKRFGNAFRGGELTPPQRPGEAAPPADVAGAYAQAKDALLASVRAPGALDKTLTMPFGEMPGSRAIGILIADQLIHTWDLAKAIGTPYSMDEELAAVVLSAMHQFMSPATRGPGKAFGEEVPCPESAPIQDRLVAFSGRHP